MDSRAEHTGLPVGYGGEMGRAAGRGDSNAVPRNGGRRREEESRVFPFAIDTGATRVGDLPMRRVPVIPANLPISAARKIAALKGIALLLVELEDQIVGVVDETVLADADDQTRTARAMNPLDFGLRPAMPVAQAHELFLRAQVSILPVIAGGFVLGAVTRADIERTLVVRP
jgi:CBS domain-containing protein